MATEGYLLGYEEEYLAAEEVPRLPDRRADSCSARWLLPSSACSWRCSSSSSSEAGPRSPTTASPGSAPGGSIDNQLQTIFQSGETRRRLYTFHAWPLIWSTILVTGVAW